MSKQPGVERRTVLASVDALLGAGASARPGAEQRAVLDEMALSWLDEHVAGEGSAEFPPVTFYEVQSGEWRSADVVPPSGAGEWTLDLSDARVGEETAVADSVAPTSTSQLSLVKGDHVEGTAAEFDFPVESDREPFGAPALSLTVEPLGPEAHLYAKFHRVVDGEATLPTAGRSGSPPDAPGMTDETPGGPP